MIEKLEYPQELDEPRGKKVDQLTHECYGCENMVFRLHFISTNGIEDIIEDILEQKVKYCPFCGLKSQPERLNPETPEGDAIV